MANTIHRCTDTGCPFVGQVTSKSCGCHKTAEQMLKERVEELEGALRGLLKGVYGDGYCLPAGYVATRRAFDLSLIHI